MDYTHIIIGGGTYGCFAALTLAERFDGAGVLIVEQEPDLMRRASHNNQARVHSGYHYPRSLLTALRSRINAPRFVKEFGDAIFSDFDQYYAISRRRSNVTAWQFEQFCRRIGAEIRPAPSHIRKLFDDDFIEAAFGVTEYAFDADKLRECLRIRIQEKGIKVLTEKEAMKVTVERGSEAAADQRYRLEIRNLRSGEREEFRCKYLYNCAYSRLNEILARSGLDTIHLKHEATEIALVEVPPSLRNLGITVMCGPFFSLMPFPPMGLATISHVSYTPHYEWVDEGEHVSHKPAFPLQTRFDRMRRDAARYVPALRDCAYVRSLWEVKTILPQSGANDSRPILFKRDSTAPNVISLLGGKIDNIFDLDEVLPRPGDGRIGSGSADQREG